MVCARTFEDAARSQCSFHLQPVDGQALSSFRPGQFLAFTLQLADATQADGVWSVTCCYSRPDAASTSTAVCGGAANMRSRRDWKHWRACTPTSSCT
jgi:ferredoxin-NADP reductase